MFATVNSGVAGEQGKEEDDNNGVLHGFGKL